ncbi:MAG: dTDP-4-dehydrorhamnose reductase [Bacteroidota bacterium]
MKKLLVFGASGQLGRILLEEAKAQTDWRVFAYTRSQLDITDQEALEDAFAEVQPDFCINCAAYTAVDRAEHEADKAMLVNGTSAGRLASVARQYNCAFLHYSTDYVYANTYNRPLLETDTTGPSNAYAESKLAGEHAILDAYSEASFIIRTGWVYSEYGHNFVLSMLRLGREREQLRVVYDQIGGPTYARDLARASLSLLQSEAEPGLYNYANAGATSWYDFCLAIHELAGIETCAVSPITSDGYPSPAKRPHYSVLNTHKMVSASGQLPRHWRMALKECMDRM